MIFSIRVIITLALVFGVYKETGIFTAISLTLIFIGFEGIGYILNGLRMQ